MGTVMENGMSVPRVNENRPDALPQVMRERVDVRGSAVVDPFSRTGTSLRSGDMMEVVGGGRAVPPECLRELRRVKVADDADGLRRCK